MQVREASGAIVRLVRPWPGSKIADWRAMATATYPVTGSDLRAHGHRRAVP